MSFSSKICCNRIKKFTAFQNTGIESVLLEQIQPRNCSAQRRHYDAADAQNIRICSGLLHFRNATCSWYDANFNSL